MIELHYIALGAILVAAAAIGFAWGIGFAAAVHVREQRRRLDASRRLDRRP